MVMSVPEGYLLRDGDTVLIRGKVRFSMDSADDYVHVRTASFRDFGVKLDEIGGIESFQFDVGDQAVTKDNSSGKIIAIHGKFAWLETAYELAGTVRVPCFLTVKISDLLPAPRDIEKVGADESLEIPAPAPLSPPPPELTDEEEPI